MPEANGRKFLDKVDDVKDHRPVRTLDLSYLVYRELLYPMGSWAKQLNVIRNQYAQEHHLPAPDAKLEWQDTKTGISAARTADEDED